MEKEDENIFDQAQQMRRIMINRMVSGQRMRRQVMRQMGMEINDSDSDLFICLFGVLRRFQHCTGHITTGSWKGRGNQYIQFARVVYCKLPTNGKQLPAFPLTAMTGIEPRPQRWEARVLPLCHRGPLQTLKTKAFTLSRTH